MYCPKCSQQQISDNVRFCSRCGFQLNVVKALLVDDDTTLTRDSGSRSSGNSSRKRDMTIGAMLMFAFAFFVAVVTADLPPEHNARIVQLVIAWLILSALINIIPLVRYFFRGDAGRREENSSSPGLLSGLISKIKNRKKTSALPAAHSRPAADYVTERIKTTELVAPPSITEETTNLLRRN